MQEPPLITTHEMNALSRFILSLLGSTKKAEELITEIVLVIQHATGFKSAGIRLNDGLDYPYYFTNGFDQDFVKKEMYLCTRDYVGEVIRDAEGSLSLECMCGNVICDRTNPDYPFFTAGGSFWTNSTSELLASTSESDRQTQTRNRCHSEGYESVGLIPVKANGTIFGLLQLNDRRKGKFTLELVLFLEGVCMNLAHLFAMKQAQDRLENQASDVTRLMAVRTKMLEQIVLDLEDKTKNDGQTNTTTHTLEKIDKILEELEMLKGILPICMKCKKIKDEAGYWERVEKYITNHSKAVFSHSYCPRCYEEEMAEFNKIRAK